MAEDFSSDNSINASQEARIESQSKELDDVTARAAQYQQKLLGCLDRVKELKAEIETIHTKENNDFTVIKEALEEQKNGYRILTEIVYDGKALASYVMKVQKLASSTGSNINPELKSEFEDKINALNAIAIDCIKAEQQVPNAIKECDQLIIAPKVSTLEKQESTLFNRVGQFLRNIWQAVKNFAPLFTEKKNKQSVEVDKLQKEETKIERATQEDKNPGFKKEGLQQANSEKGLSEKKGYAAGLKQTKNKLAEKILLPENSHGEQLAQQEKSSQSAAKMGKFLF